MNVDGLIVQVLPVADSDAEELADLARRLHAELLAVDAASAAPLPAEAAPEGAKGLGSLAGWLLVQFGTLDGLRAVVAAVRGWTSRTGRTVEVSIGGDPLKVTGVTSRPATPAVSGVWRSARTGGCSPPPAPTRRCGCGIDLGPDFNQDHRRRRG